MKLVIDKAVAEMFPNLRIGILLIRNADNSWDGKESKINELKRLAVASIDWEKASQRMEEWKQIYRKFGTNPKKKVPTLNALLKRSEKGLPAISPIVDIYLAHELMHLFPLGGYDLDKVNGDIFLRFSQGNEKFVAIGGKEEKTYEGEIVYADNEKVLTRRWNYKDCEQSKITEETSNAMLMAEAPLETMPTDELMAMMKSLSSWIEKLTGAETFAIILDVRESLEMKIQ